MTCVWYHFKPYDILFPKMHEPPKVKFSTLQPLCGGWSHIGSFNYIYIYIKKIMGGG